VIAPPLTVLVIDPEKFRRTLLLTGFFYLPGSAYALAVARNWCRDQSK
jgi:hypothetical protein